mgnify:FL=1
MMTKDIIKQARTLAGFTQVQLAEKLGVRQHHISQWEHGKHEPKHSTIKRVCDVCGVSLAQLNG